MMFKHNKLPFEHDDSIKFVFQHVQPLECGGQFVSSHRHNSEKHHFSDGVRLGSNPDFEDMTAFSINDNSGHALDNASKLSSRVLISDDETVRLENSKRPFGAEENLQLASKRTKQTEGSFPSFSSSCEGPFTSFAVDDQFKTRKDAAVLEGAISFPWFTCSTSVEDAQVSFPGYYEDHYRPSLYDQVEETQSSVFNYHPRKLVALGPDHQADLPVWREGSDASTSSVQILTDEESSNKWISHCVMPMPDLDNVDLDRRKIDCHCLDEGSIRCVRQHVNKAREELRSNLGHERFAELGFYDMVEDVALEWSEEEEQLFHEVVISNPASLGKNFWNVLPRAFPSRTNKDLVCYYFNVFMLRKRAEQNRSDPFNVDSDNDEWQEIDDGEFEEDEHEHEYEYEDSGVESPTDVSPPNDGNNEVDIHEECEGDEYEEDDDYGVTKPKIEDQDVHDDSCTSYEEQYNGADSSGGMTDHDFVVGDCDLKPWDIGYSRGFEKDLDFLPTCNVIEEVFGNEESWEKKD